MNALRIGIIGLLLLLVLQFVWHGWLQPPPAQRFAATLAIAVLPLVPALWIALRDPRRGVLVGGIVGLFYFCHGIGAVYGDADARVLALIETALTLVVIGASGWDARAYRRKRT